MPPKKKEHNNNLRTLVIRHYENGDSLREAVAKTWLPRYIVQYMVDKYYSTKRIDNLFGDGRKTKITATTDRLIQRKLKLNQRKSASTVKFEIENELGISLLANTIWKLAHQVGFFRPIPRKKPYVNKMNRRKRLKFVKEMLEKPVDFWKNLVSSDESKFNIFRSDGKGRGRIRPPPPVFLRYSNGIFMSSFDHVL